MKIFILPFIHLTKMDAQSLKNTQKYILSLASLDVTLLQSFPPFPGDTEPPITSFCSFMISSKQKLYAVQIILNWIKFSSPKTL